MVKNYVRIESEIREITGVRPTSRAEKLVKKFIANLNRDLSRLLVLTEAAEAIPCGTPHVPSDNINVRQADWIQGLMCISNDYCLVKD